MFLLKAAAEGKSRGPLRLLLANADDVPQTTLPSRGPTTQFKLPMGTTESKRDKLAAASQMVSLFPMDFAPGGTNIPHHHDKKRFTTFCGAVETWWRAAARTATKVAIRRTRAMHPFIRLNATVGFYSGAKAGGEHGLILAVRSRYPFPPVRE
jgi:hypothetical protein